MKKIIFSIFLLISFLNSATLMKYETVENDNNVILKLFFDSSFNGGIFEKRDKNNLTIILENTKTNEKFTNQLNSGIVKEFVISNNKNNIEINIEGSSNLETNASILQDGLELNINFINNTILKENSLKNEKNSEKKSGLGGIVKFLLFVVFIILIISFIIYRKIKKQNEEFDNFNKTNGNTNDEDDYESLDNESYDDNYENDEPTKEENFEEKMLKEEIKTHEELYANNHQSDATIIYHEKLNNDKEILLIKSKSKVYLAPISAENEIPQNIYEKMLTDKDNFNEFLKICKNKYEF